MGGDREEEKKSYTVKSTEKNSVREGTNNSAATERIITEYIIFNLGCSSKS